jgi:hypothetical protein
MVGVGFQSSAGVPPELETGGLTTSHYPVRVCLIVHKVMCPLLHYYRVLTDCSDVVTSELRDLHVQEKPVLGL